MGSKKRFLYYKHIEYPDGRTDMIPIHSKGRNTYIDNEPMHPAASDIDREIELLRPGAKVVGIETPAMMAARAREKDKK